MIKSWRIFFYSLLFHILPFSWASVSPPSVIIYFAGLISIERDNVSWSFVAVFFILPHVVSSSGARITLSSKAVNDSSIYAFTAVARVKDLSFRAHFSALHRVFTHAIFCAPSLTWRTGMSVIDLLLRVETLCHSLSQD